MRSMPAAEISAALTGIRSALEIAKAMVNLRDAEAFRTKSIELQAVVLDTLEKAIAAREAQAVQHDRIRSLETEMAGLRNWDAEKQNYELKPCGIGVVAYMLKPGRRGSAPAHWLCPNCFANGRKSFLGSTGVSAGRAWIYRCPTCNAAPACDQAPQWDEGSDS
jgi:hypothetical protein